MYCALGKAIRWGIKKGSIIIMLALAAVPQFSYAQTSTFLLQLATSDSRSAADKKWNDLKSKNTDVLGSLSPHVAEVSLPPDNKVSYRTQAGPIASRDQAENLCATLKGRGADCFVVETALFMGSTSVAANASEELPVTNERNSVPIRPLTTLPEPQPLPVMEMPTEPPPSAAPESLPWTKRHPIAPIVATDTSVTESQSASQSTEDKIVPGREPKFLDAQIVPMQAPSPVAVPTVPIQPHSSTPIEVAAAPSPPALLPPPSQNPGFFGRIFGVSSPSPAPSAPPPPVPPPSSFTYNPATTMGNVKGNVNVAEAIRVPLTTGKHGRKKPAILHLPPVYGLGGSPSENGQKSYWTQLSYFYDEMDARSFYEEFRNAYPQFSQGIRVRITHPFSSRREGRVSLRIGPFATTKDSRVICTAAGGRGLRCTIIRDLGSSSAASTKRVRVAPASNYDNRARQSSNETAQNRILYWAQLGTYSSASEAWDDWATLKANNKKLLKRVKARVSTPRMSSSLSSLYRLRTGPFASETQAEAFCTQLEAIGSNCIVLDDQ